MPLIPETKMADIGKLISLGNLLVRKGTWLVHTTTSATLILFRAFGADYMTRIAYIYSRLPRTHSYIFHLETAHSLPLTFFTYRDGTLSLSFSPLRLRDNTLCFTFSLTETTHTYTHTHTHFATLRKCMHSATLFCLFG